MVVAGGKQEQDRDTVMTGMCRTARRSTLRAARGGWADDVTGRLGRTVPTRRLFQNFLSSPGRGVDDREGTGALGVERGVWCGGGIGGGELRWLLMRSISAICVDSCSFAIPPGLDISLSRHPHGSVIARKSFAAWPTTPSSPPQGPLARLLPPGREAKVWVWQAVFEDSALVSSYPLPRSRAQANLDRQSQSCRQLPPLVLPALQVPAQQALRDRVQP
ncbi:hypothetical protein FJTKL_00997 [Diaporthe vaccinii]|uniref:Uncharacterized protein n=1 Tax=Diaporthe vaccinii TaxID=105482 RepID=A0ABR4E1L8_9PEZI